jgi:hypothetical protein
VAMNIHRRIMQDIKVDREHYFDKFTDFNNIYDNYVDWSSLKIRIFLANKRVCIGELSGRQRVAFVLICHFRNFQQEFLKRIIQTKV